MGRSLPKGAGGVWVLRPWFVSLTTNGKAP
jgi:hypothetical protein